MNICKKIITVIGFLALSLPAFAIPIHSESELVSVELTLHDVCSIMKQDTITLAKMYKDGKSPEYIVSFLEDRNDAEPAVAFAMPGIMQILGMIETIKAGSPALYSEPNFPNALGIVAYRKCTNDDARGWVQNIPGRAQKIEPPAHPKIKI